MYDFLGKAIFILGYINIISVLLIFFSCRCLAGPKITKKLWQYPWYQAFNRKHCYFWWIFFVSVILHTIIAWILF
jgi:hypothetical protein